MSAASSRSSGSRRSRCCCCRSSCSSRRCRPGPSGGTRRPSPRAKPRRSRSSTQSSIPKPRSGVATEVAAELRHRQVRHRRAASVPARHAASTSPSTCASACRRSPCLASCRSAAGPTRRRSTAGSTTTGVDDARRTRAPRRCGCSVSASRCCSSAASPSTSGAGSQRAASSRPWPTQSRRRRRTASTRPALRHGTVQLDPVRAARSRTRRCARDDARR